MRPIRRVLLITPAALLVMHVGTPVAPAQSPGKIRFGVGPLQPTSAETKKAYEPFFAYVARKLDRDFDLVATTDCTRLHRVAKAGVAVVASLHQVHLAMTYADRIVALRAGRVIADAPAASLDARAIEQIYAKDGEPAARSPRP